MTVMTVDIIIDISIAIDVITVGTLIATVFVVLREANIFTLYAHLSVRYSS